MNLGVEMLKFGEAQRLSGSSDSVVIPVGVDADRVDRAPDVHVRHGSHEDTKLEVVQVALVESSLLTFARLVLIVCFDKIRFHEEHQQRESGLRDEATETIDGKDAARVDTVQFGESEMERHSATTRLVQAHQSSDTVSLPSRLDVTVLQLKMQQFR